MHREWPCTTSVEYSSGLEIGIQPRMQCNMATPRLSGNGFPSCLSCLAAFTTAVAPSYRTYDGRVSEPTPLIAIHHPCNGLARPHLMIPNCVGSFQNKNQLRGAE